jgi:predicted RNA-binding protein Jag
MKTKLTLSTIAAIALLASFAHADTLLIRSETTGALTFNNIPLPAVDESPAVLTNLQTREYVSDCKGGKLTMAQVETKQQISVAQTKIDTLNVEFVSSLLERMDTEAQMGCTVQVPVTTNYAYRTSVSLRLGETKRLAQFNGEQFTITRVADKK